MRELGIGGGIGFFNLTTTDKNLGWLYDYPENEKANLYWWPVYLSLKYNLPLASDLNPYLKLDNGYTFFDATENAAAPNTRIYDMYYVYGGYYMSLGAGLTFSRIINLELSYSLLNSGAWHRLQNRLWLQLFLLGRNV